MPLPLDYCRCHCGNAAKMRIRRMSHRMNVKEEKQMAKTKGETTLAVATLAAAAATKSGWLRWFSTELDAKWVLTRKAFVASFVPLLPLYARTLSHTRTSTTRICFRVRPPEGSRKILCPIKLMLFITLLLLGFILWKWVWCIHRRKIGVRKQWTSSRDYSCP